MRQQQPTLAAASLSSQSNQQETYYSLPSESPPSPVSYNYSPPPEVVIAPNTNVFNNSYLKKKSKSKQNAKKSKGVPRKLDATGTIRSDTLEPAISYKPREPLPIATKQETKEPEKTSKWSWFGSKSSSESKNEEKFEEKYAPNERSAQSYHKDSTASSGSDTAGQTSSSSSDEDELYRQQIYTSSPVSKKQSMSKLDGRKLSSSSGYFSDLSPTSYQASDRFEQFPASEISPPESEEILPEPVSEPKVSWLKDLFTKKQDQKKSEKVKPKPNDRADGQAMFAANGPPSPPQSVLSTASTLRSNVNARNQSTVSLPISTRPPLVNSQSKDSGGRSPESVASTAATMNNVNSRASNADPNNRSWAFWSRQSKDKSSNNEDGVIAFSGPNQQTYSQKQRGLSIDNTSMPVPDKNQTATSPTSFRSFSRNASRATLGGIGSYQQSYMSGSTTNLNGYDIYNGTPAGGKLGRGGEKMNNDTKSVRTIETIGKPRKDLNTVKSANGAKETALMAPAPTNATGNNMVKAEQPILESSKEKDKKKKKKGKEDQVRYPNMVVPRLEDCLEPESPPSAMWHSLSNRIARIFEEPKPASETHLRLHITPPPKIRKAVAIGIHGFFPIRMVRSIIGEPTGTSVKFANEAASAIQRWAEAHGQADMDIEKIALEGEGIVLDRIENLYRLLSNWMDHLHQADFVLIAAHSQGTPVAVQLVAKLIEEGHADNTKIGILGMAGVSLGPFYGLDQKLVMRAYSSIEHDSLRELFAFQNPNSLQARRYISGLRTVIAHGAKITFVGSVNDQLVPLYSSLCANVTHPYIFRSVFVDGKTHAPTFIIHLIELLVKLRNYGYSDDGILRDISDAMAGTLTGGGHSLIYNENAVYDLAIQHALETSEMQGLPVRVDDKFEVPTPANYNPYHLPWSVRGMLEQDVVREHFEEDITRVLNKFDVWNPDTKPLKDIKYRLSAIRSPVTHGSGKKPPAGMPVPGEIGSGASAPGVMAN
ncbi:hypothetical protein BZA70DRAFT_283682 [Myxozyma melibiosi]|uniref:YMC020W-like alpha/beta hydrolase domain-containing protein n=1 Tax=Myxozyma melibiosi TaxID=54550 RepID=A0ABR1F0Y5_9ASCO